MYLWVCLFIFMSICLSVCLFICVCMCSYVCLSVHRYVYLFISLSDYLINYNPLPLIFFTPSILLKLLSTVERADIVCCTLSGAGSQPILEVVMRIPGFKFDAVIIGKNVTLTCPDSLQSMNVWDKWGRFHYLSTPFSLDSPFFFNGRYFVLFYPILFHHIASHNILSYMILSHHILSYSTLSYCLSINSILSYFTLCGPTLYSSATLCLALIIPNLYLVTVALPFLL